MQKNSAWARGQAWDVYGMALAYHYTKDEKCLELFRNMTDFFIDHIDHLPEKGVPYWDLVFSDRSSEPWDSSASAIAVCGIYEIVSLPEKEKRKNI